MPRFLPALAALLVLAACGGGSGGAASVSTMAATGVAYGDKMTITVSGSELTTDTLQLVVEGPCSGVAPTGTPSDLQLQYTCTVTGTGPVIPRLRNANGLELASLWVDVPVPQVSMTVSQGSRTGIFVIELDPAAAPLTVKNFLAYVATDFYKSTLFHRVIPGFVVQGGGYTTGPKKKTTGVLPPIVNEAGNGLKNLQYTVAMARTSDPNSATSEFFVNLVDNPALDYGSTQNPAGYAVFGKVVSGTVVIDEIGKVPTATVGNLADVPVTDVVITAATRLK